MGLAGISCLWLPTCVDEMGWGILVTVQCTTCWSQMREGMQSHNLSLDYRCCISELNGWLQSCLGIGRMRYFENLIISQARYVHLFCNEKRSGLWMVRSSLYRGGRRLVFASDNLRVCGQEFML